ncbi:hypothetical protein HYC85_016962 [Camellia sinensis]|uniref:PHD finger protein MALE STERILITY 1-like ubiquitin-like domain-containing protein n=1 Tax=Camellia sinensis TaxID=4442 RepID=A0A7J7H4F8_CAMSI|nr:hypothetical protein HYC85_016962 [Camellia sinensis]
MQPKSLTASNLLKDYKPDKMAAATRFAIYLWCHTTQKMIQPQAPAPAPELLILPQNASVADLKLEATKAFQEVYAFALRALGRFHDTETSGGINGANALEHMGLVISEWRSKRRTGRCWLVTRGICQHTRCAGIDYYDAIPAKFIRMRCLNSYREASKEAQFNEAAKMGRLSSRTCRNEAATTNTSKLGSSFDYNFWYSFTLCLVRRFKKNNWKEKGKK